MKFTKEEKASFLSTYHVQLRKFGLGSNSAKDYFQVIMSHYFQQTGDTYGKIQKTKAKYLLKGNTQEALDFQEELIADILNRVLSLPDKSLALEDQEAGAKFLRQRHHDVCMLLLLDKLLGENFDRGAAADFRIPEETLEVLRHKRALLDPNSNELPDAAYDGRFLDKHRIKNIVPPDQAPLPEHDELQAALNNVNRAENIPGRDSFDVFLENIADVNELQRSINDKLPDLPTDTKRQFSAFFKSLADANSQTSRFYSHYGRNSLLYNNDFKAGTFAEAITAIRNCPEELADALSGNSEIMHKFQSMLRALKGTDLVINGGECTKNIIRLPNGIDYAEYSGALIESIQAAAKRQSEKTLYANIDLIRNKMNEFGEIKKLSDKELVAQVSTCMLEHPESQPERQLPNAVDLVRHAGLTAAQEMEFQKNFILTASAKAESPYEWAQVARSIAKIEVLKTMEADAPVDQAQLENLATEKIKEKPLISRNVSMHDRKLCEDYLSGSADFINAFHYKDAPLPEADLEEAYADMQRNLVTRDGEHLLTGNKPSILWEKRKDLMQRAANEDRMCSRNCYPMEFADALSGGLPKGWERLHTPFMKFPREEVSAKEIYAQNEQFLINLINNEILPNGRTFRQQTLLDEIERIKNLDPQDLFSLASASDEEILERWPDIAEKWGTAYIAIDVKNAAETEGLQLSKEDKDLLQFQLDVATCTFDRLSKYRDHYLTNPYAQLAAGVEHSKLSQIYYSPAFAPRFSNDMANLDGQKATFEQAVPILSALKAAGLLPPADLSHTVVRTQPDGTDIGPLDAQRLALKYQDFSIQEPGKQQVFYHFDPVIKQFYHAMSLEELNTLQTKYLNIAIAREANKEYTDRKECRAVILTPLVRMRSKFTDRAQNSAEPAVHVSKMDAARILAMQAALEHLEKRVGKPEEFMDAFEQIANEEYVAELTNNILSDPMLESFINGLGGMDENGHLSAQAQYALGKDNALENFRRFCDKELSNQNPPEGWNQPLSPEQKAAMKEAIANELTADSSKIHQGEENAQLYAATNKIFQYLLLQKSIDNNTPLTQRELTETAYAYTFDPANTNLRLSTVSPRFTEAFVSSLNGQPADKYPIAKKLGKMLDHYLETQQEGYENEEAFFERKFTETHQGQQVNADVKAASKKEFLTLCEANHLIWLGNPDKVKTLDQIWTLHTDNTLQDPHNAAVEQMQQMHGNRELKDARPVGKSYLKRCLAFNFPDNPTDAQRIEIAKAKALLAGNSPEALAFQKQYIMEMINQMLSIPDEKLAQSNSPDSRAYFAEHYREIQMLHELPNFYGNLAANTAGLVSDFIIPTNIEDALFHKHALAAQYINNDKEMITALADENYKALRLFNGLTQTELLEMGQENGIYSASKEIKQLPAKQISGLHSEKNKNSAAADQPNAAKYDHLQLTEDQVWLRAIPENLTLKQKVASLEQAVDSGEIEDRTHFETFRRALQNFDAQYDEAISAADGDLTPVFSAMKSAAQTYKSDVVPAGRSFSELPAADQAAVKFATGIVNYCEEKSAYYAMKKNVEGLEAQLGMINLPLELDPNRTYTLEAYRSLLQSSRDKCAEAIRSAIHAGTEVKPEHLTRLFVLDTLRKGLSYENLQLDANDAANIVNEEYLQKRMNALADVRPYKQFIANNQPLTEDFPEKNLADEFELRNPAAGRNTVDLTFRDAIRMLRKDLRRMDSVFSRDSIEYRNFNRALGQLFEKIERNGMNTPEAIIAAFDRKDQNGMSVLDYAVEYEEAKKSSPNPLSDRQMGRLTICARLHTIREELEKAANLEDLSSCKKQIALDAVAQKAMLGRLKSIGTQDARNLYKNDRLYRSNLTQVKSALQKKDDNTLTALAEEASSSRVAEKLVPGSVKKDADYKSEQQLAKNSLAVMDPARIPMAVVAQYLLNRSSAMLDELEALETVSDSDEYLAFKNSVGALHLTVAGLAGHGGINQQTLSDALQEVSAAAKFYQLRHQNDDPLKTEQKNLARLGMAAELNICKEFLEQSGGLLDEPLDTMDLFRKLSVHQDRMRETEILRKLYQANALTDRVGTVLDGVAPAASKNPFPGRLQKLTDSEAYLQVMAEETQKQYGARHFSAQEKSQLMEAVSQNKSFDDMQEALWNSKSTLEKTKEIFRLSEVNRAKHPEFLGIDSDTLDSMTANCRNVFNFDTNRQGLSSFFLADLLKKGYDFDSIMDPTKLIPEKQACVESVLQKVQDPNAGKELAEELLAAGNATYNYVSEKIANLKDLTVQELTKPENKNIFIAQGFTLAIKQELERKQELNNPQEAKKGKTKAPLFYTKYLDKDDIQNAEKFMDNQAASALFTSFLSDSMKTYIDLSEGRGIDADQNKVMQYAFINTLFKTAKANGLIKGQDFFHDIFSADAKYAEPFKSAGAYIETGRANEPEKDNVILTNFISSPEAKKDVVDFVFSGKAKLQGSYTKNGGLKSMTLQENFNKLIGPVIAKAKAREEKLAAQKPSEVKTGEEGMQIV